MTRPTRSVVVTNPGKSTRSSGNTGLKADLNGIGFSDAQGNPLTLGAAVILAASVNLLGDDALGPLDKFRVGEMGMCAFKGLPMTDAQIAVAKDTRSWTLSGRA